MNIYLQHKYYISYYDYTVAKELHNPKSTEMFLTLTSLRSLFCNWFRGSRKFCFTLSSKLYLISAKCLNDSPASIRQLPAETARIKTTTECIRISLLLNAKCYAILCSFPQCWWQQIITAGYFCFLYVKRAHTHEQIMAFLQSCNIRPCSRSCIIFQVVTTQPTSMEHCKE